MKQLLPVLFLFLNSACVKITDKESDHQGAQVLKTENVSIKYSEKPNSYQVHLPLPEGVELIQRIEIGTGSRISLPWVVQKGHLIDTQPEHGKIYAYDMGVVEDGIFRLIQNYEIEIPQDLVINGHVHLTAATNWSQYRRLFFMKDAQIWIHQFDLKIQAQEIISEGVLIKSFPENTKQGRSAGTVSMTAETGSGIINLYLTGEDGADGLNGAISSCNSQNPIDAHENGKDGQQGGGSGQVFVTITAHHDLKISMDTKPGQGGIAGTGSLRCMGSKITQDGKPGPSGQWFNSCIYDFRNLPCQVNR